MRPLSDLPLADEDRRALLARARRAIFEAVSTLNLPDPPLAAGRLANCAGAFVTLRCNGRLRGCMGHTDSAHTLEETVVQCAITAALQDPRFAPLSVEEMDALEIEISVLSKLWPARPEEIEVGVHGILVSRGIHRGLLLPQVAVEHNWSTIQFLEAASRKAGLETNAWRDLETKLFAFTAEVFSEVGLVTLNQQTGK